MFVQEFLQRKQYRLIKKIGEGTYARVYQAENLMSHHMVAVKVINVLKMDQKKIENALNEVRIICAIEHPNVVGYEDAFIDEVNKDLYIVMEFLGGGDLNDRISGLVKKKAYLREKRVWRYAVQVLQGLKSLHDKKIIHRDIKPGNVFVSEDLETLKLGDLNVSKIMREREMTQTVIGTPYYLPPEIWKNQEYDYRCDVFSFGCVLYELTALRVPFQAKNIRELFHKIQFAALPKLPRGYSLDLYRFIKFCLTKEIRKRPTVDVLLCHPLIVSRRHLFEDIWVTRDESLKGRKGRKGRNKGRKRGGKSRKTSGEGVLEMRVETQDLSKLSRMLPSLKNSRSSSAKVFGFGSSAGLLKAKASRKNLGREKESAPSEASQQDMEAETDDIRQRWGLIQNSQSNQLNDVGSKNSKTNKTNKMNKSNKSNSEYANEDLRRKRGLKKSERQKVDPHRHSNHPSQPKTFFIQKRDRGESGKNPYDFGSVSSSAMARRKARMSVQNSCKRRVGRKVISQRGSRKALGNRTHFKGKEFLKVKTKGVVENPARLNYIKQVKEKHRRRDEFEGEGVGIGESRDVSLRSKGRTLPHRKNRAKSPKRELVVQNFENLVDSTLHTPSHSFLKPETPSRSWKRSDVGEESSVLQEKGLLITPRSKRPKKTSEHPSSRFESEHETSYSKRPKDQTVLSSSQRAKDFESTPNSMRYLDQVARSTKLGGRGEKKQGKRKRKRKSGAGLMDTNSGGMGGESPSLGKGALHETKRSGKKNRKSINTKTKTRNSESGVTGGHDASKDIREDCLEQTGEISLSEGSENERIIEIEIMEGMDDSMDEGCSKTPKQSDALETKSKPTSKRNAERASEEKCPRRMRKSRSHSFVKDAIEPSAKISKSKVVESKRDQSNTRKPQAINATETQKKKTKTFYLRPPKIVPRQNKTSKNTRPKIYNRNGQSETGSSESQRTSKRGFKKSNVLKTRRSKFRPRPPLKEGGGKGRLVGRSYFQMSTNFEKELPGNLGAKGPKSRSKSESKHVSERKLVSARRVGVYVAGKSFVMPGKLEREPGVEVGHGEVGEEGKKQKAPSRGVETPKTSKARGAVGRKKKKGSVKNKAGNARTKRARNEKLVSKNKTPKKKSSFARSERAMPRFRNLKVRRASSRKGGSVEYKVRGKFGSRLAASQIVGGRKNEKRVKEIVERRFLSQIETLEENESEVSGTGLGEPNTKEQERMGKGEARKLGEMKGRNKMKLRIVPKEATVQEKREERLRRKSQLQPEGVYAAIEEMPEQEMNTERTGPKTNRLLPLPQAIPTEVVSEENPMLNSGLFLSKKEMRQNGDSGAFGFELLKPGMRLKKLKALKQPRELKSFEEKGEEQASTCKLSEKKNWTAADEKKKTIGKKGYARKIKGAGKSGGNLGERGQKRTRVSRSRKVDSKFHSQGKTFVNLRGQGGIGLKTGLESSLRVPLAKRQKPSVYKRKRPQNLRNTASGRKDASKSQILERGYLYGRKLKKSSRVNSRANIRTSHVAPVEGQRNSAMPFKNSESNNTSKRGTTNSVTGQTESGNKKKRAANGLNFILNPVLTENTSEDHRRTIDSIGLPQRQFMQSSKINNSNDPFKGTGEHNETMVAKSVHIHVPKNSLVNLEKMRSKRKRLSEVGIELRSPPRGLALREALDHSISIEMGLKGTSEGFSADVRPRSQNQSETSNALPPKRRKHRRSVKGGGKMVKTANDLGKGEAPSYKSRKVPKARLNSRKPTTGQSVAKRRLRNYGDMLRKKQKYKRKMKEKDRAVSKPAQKVGGKKKRRLRVLGYGSSRVIDKKSQFG